MKGHKRWSGKCRGCCSIKGKLAILQKECDIIRQPAAISKRSVEVLCKELEVVSSSIRSLESENTTLQKKLETLSTTPAELKAVLTKALGETRENSKKEKSGFEALKGKVSKLKNISQVHQSLKHWKFCMMLLMQMGRTCGDYSCLRLLGAKAISHLATPVVDSQLNLCVTARTASYRNG